MKTKITLLFVLSIFFLVSCSQDEMIDSTANLEFGGGPGGNTGNVDGNNNGPEAPNDLQTDLIAGQNIYVGLMDVTVTDGNVTVVYSTDGDWIIEETHLYIGDLNNLPATGSGDPKIGHFPYKGVHTNYTTFVSYTGPALVEGECTYIAAHAVVTNVVTGQTETAWGDGEPLPGNSWAMAFEYCY
jgi:hypothetical protein